MATNRVQPGKVLTWTNGTGAAVVSGKVVVIGTVVAVALGDIAAGAAGDVAVKEVYSVPKATGVIAQGARVYWDADGNPVGGTAGTGAATTTAASNTLMGYAAEGAASGDATVNVALNAATTLDTDT